MSAKSLRANNLDSLEQALILEEDILVKVDILEKLSWGYMHIDREKALFYIIRYWKLVRNEKLGEELCVADNLLGVYNALGGKYTIALDFFTKSYDCAGRHKYESVSMAVGNNLALMYINRGETDRALEYHRRSYESAEKMNDTLKMHLYLTNIGYDLIQISECEKSLTYLEKAEVLMDGFKPEVDKQKTALNQKGICYHNLSFANVSLGNIALAKKYIDKSIAFFKASGNKYDLIVAYLRKAEIYRTTQNEYQARHCYETSIRIANESDFLEPLIDIYSEYTAFTHSLGAYEEALVYANKVIELAEEESSWYQKAGALDILSKVYREQNDMKKAYHYNAAYNKLMDTLIVIERDSEIANVDYRSELSRRKTENKILKSERKINESLLKKDSLINISILCILGIVVLITGFLFNVRKYNVKLNDELERLTRTRSDQLETQNQQLEITKSELERFAHVTSHDLKEPLRNIGGFIGLIQRRGNKDLVDGTKDRFSKILLHVSKMESIVDDTLSFYGTDQSKLEVEEVCIKDLLDEIQDESSILLKMRDVQISYEKLPAIYAYRFHIKTLLKHLVVNSIEHNSNDLVKVLVSCEEEENDYVLCVVDNGVGMSQDDYNEIFVSSRRIDPGQSNTTGMGLSICRKIIELNSGEVLMTSLPSTGTAFTIRLPKQKNNTLKKEETLVSV